MLCLLRAPTVSDYLPGPEPNNEKAVTSSEDLGILSQAGVSPNVVEGSQGAASPWSKPPSTPRVHYQCNTCGLVRGKMKKILKHQKKTSHEGLKEIARLKIIKSFNQRLICNDLSGPQPLSTTYQGQDPTRRRL